VASGRLENVRQESLPVSATKVTAKDVSDMELRLGEATGSWSTDGSTRRPPVTIGRIVNPPRQWSVATKILVDPDGTVWVGAPRSYLNVAEDTREIGNNIWFAVARNASAARRVLPSSFELVSVNRGFLFGIDHAADDPAVVKLGLVR
jgi:hypothetical protein